MLDIDDIPLRPIASIVVGLLRFIVWLWSEFLFETLGWKLGWCVCRLLSLGKFPQADFSSEEEASIFTRIVVELLGIGTLCFAAWRLSIAFDL